MANIVLGNAVFNLGVNTPDTRKLKEFSNEIEKIKKSLIISPVEKQGSILSLDKSMNSLTKSTKDAHSYMSKFGKEAKDARMEMDKLSKSLSNIGSSNISLSGKMKGGSSGFGGLGIGTTLTGLAVMGAAYEYNQSKNRVRERQEIEYMGADNATKGTLFRYAKNNPNILNGDNLDLMEEFQSAFSEIGGKKVNIKKNMWTGEYEDENLKGLEKMQKDLGLKTNYVNDFINFYDRDSKDFKNYGKFIASTADIYDEVKSRIANAKTDKEKKLAEKDLNVLRSDLKEYGFDIDDAMNNLLESDDPRYKKLRQTFQKEREGKPLTKEEQDEYNKEVEKLQTLKDAKDKFDKAFSENVQKLTDGALSFFEWVKEKFGEDSTYKTRSYLASEGIDTSDLRKKDNEDKGFIINNVKKFFDGK